MKIETVSALQGAERPIVIFSTIYPRTNIGKGSCPICKTITIFKGNRVYDRFGT